jgi:ABC-type iron transport system FetAB ATPase subunit
VTHPTVLFLDEATSILDVASETSSYAEIVERGGRYAIICGTWMSYADSEAADPEFRGPRLELG